jgi:hypothetical protein
VDHDAEDRHRAAEHGGRGLEVAQLHRLPDRGARHGAAAEHHLAHHVHVEAQRAQAFGRPLAVLAELAVEAEDEAARVEPAAEVGVGERVHRHRPQLVVEAERHGVLDPGALEQLEAVLERRERAGRAPQKGLLRVAAERHDRRHRAELARALHVAREDRPVAQVDPVEHADRDHAALSASGRRELRALEGDDHRGRVRGRAGGRGWAAR